MSRNTLAVVGIAVLVVLATVGVAGFVGLDAAGAQESEDSTTDRSITVSATGSAEASPDQAEVRVSVTAEGNDTEEVRSTLATRAEDLRANLDELGVEYETVQYSIEEMRPHERERRQERSDEPVPEYRGVHAFLITLDDTDRVGDVIGASTDAEAEVDRVVLTLSEERREELRNDAIENAMSDARTQASTIADAANLSLTTVATVDASQDHYRPVAYESADAGDGGGGPPTVIEGGEVSVTYNVEVTYNATA